MISQRSAKSELERYVDGLVVSLRIQAAKRPEEWVRWGGLFLSIQLYFWVSWIAGLVAFLGAIFGSIALVQRRLAPGDPSKLSGKLLEESAPGAVRRELKQANFDAKVGTECRAILEASAQSANAILFTAAKAAMVEGGGREALTKFKPLTSATEGLMKGALARIQFATLQGRTPDQESINELKKIEANLRVVLKEAKRLAPSSEPAADALEEIHARIELDEAS